MNADMTNRIMEARKYQKKAIMALFPDSMAGHIEVIEKELSAMIMEYAVEIAGQCMQQKDVNQDASKQEESHKSKVRKVNIEI